jgi:SNF2 family DNA or RNA helicase
MACPICLKPIRSFPIMLADGARVKKKSGKPKSSELETWLTRLKKGAHDAPASAKTLGFKAQVLNWLHDEPKVKIIIFSEWRGMLDILERVCQVEPWSYVRVDGQLSAEQRNKRLEEFRNEDCSILLATKKVGGVGLNLAHAARVAIMDP